MAAKTNKRKRHAAPSYLSPLDLKMLRLHRVKNSLVSHRHVTHPFIGVLLDGVGDRWRCCEQSQFSDRRRQIPKWPNSIDVPRNIRNLNDFVFMKVQLLRHHLRIAYPLSQRRRLSKGRGS